MTHDLHALFAEAAADAPASEGLPGRVLDRQRRTERRRLNALGALGALVIALSAAAGLGPLRPGPDRTAYVALAADGTVDVVEPDCQPDTVDSTPIPVEDVPPDRRLRSTDPRYRFLQEFANRVENCVTDAAVPLALGSTTADGSVQQALTVSGPLPEPLDLEGRAVAVRGHRGQIIDGRTPNRAEATALAWTGRDDRHWVAQASGFTAAQLVQAVNDLSINGTAVTLPGTDLTDYGPSPAEPVGPSVEWDASYRDATGREFTARTYSSTQTLLGTFTGPRGNGRLVRVNGRPALVSSNGAGLGDALQILRLELQPGLWAEARAVDVRPDELVAFADSLTVE